LTFRPYGACPSFPNCNYKHFVPTGLLYPVFNFSDYLSIDEDGVHPLSHRVDQIKSLRLKKLFFIDNPFVQLACIEKLISKRAS
jgi:hypothetical protein